MNPLKVTQPLLKKLLNIFSMNRFPNGVRECDHVGKRAAFEIYVAPQRVTSLPRLGDEVVESEKDREGQRNNGCGRSPKNEVDLRGNGKGGEGGAISLLLLGVVPWDGPELSPSRLPVPRRLSAKHEGIHLSGDP